MSTLLMSTKEDGQVKDREWLLHLLLAGMKGPQDGDVCRQVLNAIFRDVGLLAGNDFMAADGSAGMRCAVLGCFSTRWMYVQRILDRNITIDAFDALNG